MRPLQLRGRVVLASAFVLAFGVAVIGITINVLLTYRLDADADAVLRARADAQLATVDLNGKEVVVSEGTQDEALDREAWVLVNGKAVARPSAPTDVNRAAFALAAAPAGASRDVAGRVRLQAEPAYAPGQHRFRDSSYPSSKKSTSPSSKS